MEAVYESFPQIVLLLADFFVTIVDPDSLSISDDDSMYDVYGPLPIPSIRTMIFFILNILYSMLTLLFSLVNATNTAKGGQLRHTQKKERPLLIAWMVEKNVRYKMRKVSWMQGWSNNAIMIHNTQY